MDKKIKNKWNCSFEEHEKKQILDIALNTTPKQRFEHLEKMVQELAPIILANRQRKS